MTTKRMTEKRLVQARINAALVNQIDHYAIEKRISRQDAIQWLLVVGLGLEKFVWPPAASQEEGP